MSLRTAAIALMLVAVSAGEAAADFYTALEAYESGRYERAMEEMRQLAEDGDAAAQYYVALMYEYGDGVPRNYRAAIVWYRRAALQGDADAQNSLGALYDEGKGVERSPQKAYRWYLEAAEQGNALAQTNLGLMYFYAEGSASDREGARYWFTQAANREDPVGLYYLGRLHAEGFGVPRDLARAAHWYTRAAEFGDVDAQYELGMFYRQGMGVEEDPVLAYKWLNLAAAAGVDAAISARDELEEIMDGQDIIEGQNLSSRFRLRVLDTTAGESYSDEPFARELIYDVESLLGALGYEPGRVDGVPDGATEGAARAFQADQSLTEDGLLTPRLLETLRTVFLARSGATWPTGTDPWLAGSGSGFLIDGRHVLTNQHVIVDCTAIVVHAADGPVFGERVAAVAFEDLAVLRIPDTGRTGAAFREAPPRLGEAIRVAGFPLADYVGNYLSVVSGEVSALFDHSEYEGEVQVSAPIHPGNSGGPLLDGAGRVVGVVASTLNAQEVIDDLGYAPQNIGYAISAEVAMSFLDGLDLAYRTDGPEAPLGGEAIADQARSHTVAIECFQ